jgi:hypothetical protein
MTAKKVKPIAATKAAQAEPHKTNTLNVTLKTGQTKEHQLAKLGLSPCFANAHTATLFIQGSAGKLDIGEAFDVMEAKAVKTGEGDLSELEATLTAQAVTLNTVFNELARRAAFNMGQHIDATEKYMRLALKAQGQCRATVETLAEIKFPRSATFIKQANIAQQQQVNNGQTGIESSTHAGAPEKTINPTNELISEQANATLDTAGAGTASSLDSKLEAVETVNRAKVRGRQARSIN